MRNDGLLYLTKASCPWVLLPSCFGPWKMVYDYFRRTPWLRAFILRLRVGDATTLDEIGLKSYVQICNSA